MAAEDPVVTNPPTVEDARHVRDYSLFTALLKWGAIISFAIAMFLLLFVL